MSPKQSPSDRSAASSTNAARRLAAQRSAAARQRLATAQKRRRLIAVGSAVLTVLVVVAVLVVVKLTTGAGGPSSGATATSAKDALVAELASVPAATLNTVGAGTVDAGPVAVSAPALSSGGKPEVFYVGAEFCPYCAAERWPLVVALSRFGTFHGLGETASAPQPEVFPDTRTLTFHGATFTSQYVTLVAKEVQSNQVVDGLYTLLDKLTAAQQALYSKYDAKPYVDPGIPFLDFGGKYVSSGAYYQPSVLQGLSHQQIADALSDPTSPVAKAVDGGANLISAAVCRLTGQQPSSVCTSAGVRAAASKLPAASGS